MIEVKFKSAYDTVSVLKANAKVTLNEVLLFCEMKFAEGSFTYFAIYDDDVLYCEMET